MLLCFISDEFIHQETTISNHLIRCYQYNSLGLTSNVIQTAFFLHKYYETILNELQKLNEQHSAYKYGRFINYFFFAINKLKRYFEKILTRTIFEGAVSRAVSEMSDFQMAVFGRANSVITTFEMYAFGTATCGQLFLR